MAWAGGFAARRPADPPGACGLASAWEARIYLVIGFGIRQIGGKQQALGHTLRRSTTLSYKSGLNPAPPMQAEASDCFVIVDAGVLLFVTSYRILPLINVLAFVTVGATLALAGCATLPDQRQ